MPPVHSTHLLSAVVGPVVQKDPSAQAVASEYVQAAQESLLPTENVAPVQSTHLLSAVVEPVVQTDPSLRSACVGSVQPVHGQPSESKFFLERASASASPWNKKNIIHTLCSARFVAV